MKDEPLILTRMELIRRNKEYWADRGKELDEIKDKLYKPLFEFLEEKIKEWEKEDGLQN